MSIPSESYCITSAVTRTTACLAFPHAPSTAICGKVDINERENRQKESNTLSQSRLLQKQDGICLKEVSAVATRKKNHLTSAIGPYELDAGNPYLHYTPYLPCPVLAFQDHLSQRLLLHLHES